MRKYLKNHPYHVDFMGLFLPLCLLSCLPIKNDVELGSFFHPVFSAKRFPIYNIFVNVLAFCAMAWPTFPLSGR